MHTLRERVVLLIDDDLAESHRILQFLRLRGASVLGPVPNVPYALEIIQTERKIDYAIVDRVLQGDDTYAIADALLVRQIPFVFVTDNDESDLAPGYRHIPCRLKPLALPALAEELLARVSTPRLFEPAAAGVPGA